MAEKESKHKYLEKPFTKKKPSDFRGCISKEIAEKMIFEIEQSRNEWERDIRF